MSSVANRSRFSREPPYLSVRLLVRGDRNSDNQLYPSWEIRVHTMHKVSVSAVDFNEIESDLLAPLDGF